MGLDLKSVHRKGVDICGRDRIKIHYGNIDSSKTYCLSSCFRLFLLNFTIKLLSFTDVEKEWLYFFFLFLVQARCKVDIL